MYYQYVPIQKSLETYLMFLVYLFLWKISQNGYEPCQGEIRENFKDITDIECSTAIITCLN